MQLQSQGDAALNLVATLSAFRSALSAAVSRYASTRPESQIDRPANGIGGGSSNRWTILVMVLGVTENTFAIADYSRSAFSGSSAKAVITPVNWARTAGISPSSSQ